jgi:hypothetical protein
VKHVLNLGEIPEARFEVIKAKAKFDVNKF